jgi:ADP-heptose:LPS heptosyltransferase
VAHRFQAISFRVCHRLARLAPGGHCTTIPLHRRELKLLEPHQPPAIIRFGRLGDMIMLTALMASLRHRYGTPCQVIAAGPWNEQIYRGHPDVARMWSFARHLPFTLSLAWPSVFRALRQSSPAPIYVCETHDRQLIRIRRLLKSCGVDPARCAFITDDPSPPGEHWIDRLLRFGERTPPSVRSPATASPTDRRWAPRLQVLDQERAHRDDWLRANGWWGRQLVLIQPGNFRSMSSNRERPDRMAADDKAWPVKHWVELFNLIHRHSPEAVLVLCGASREVAMLQRIQAEVGQDRVAVAALTLRELFALCESAHSMISIDTGPAHAAAALNVPLVVMYGAESPARWLPRSGSDSPVVGIGGPPASTRVDQIAVGQVFESWCALARHHRVPAICEEIAQ